MKILHHRYTLILLVVLLIATLTASITIIIMYLAARCVSITNPVSYRHGFTQEQYQECTDGVMVRIAPVFCILDISHFVLIFNPVWTLFFIVFVCSRVRIIEFYYDRGGSVIIFLYRSFYLYVYLAFVKCSAHM
jgi:hypothetical protein